MFVKTTRSSNLYSINYEPETFEDGKIRGVLIIQFKGSMARYAYFNVPVSLVEYVLGAPSIGKAYNAVIKKNFEGTKLQ